MASHEDDFIARASTVVDADARDVWDALVDPVAIRHYMFGTSVETDWRGGQPHLLEG